MSIEVPKEFECPITLDVMINPVRANCVAAKPKEPTGIFSYFFTRGSDDSCSGHFFEGLALAAYLRRIDQNCPTCRQKITKAIPDKDLAAKITREFINKSAAHKTHFEDAEKEVNLNYGNMKSLPIIPDDPALGASPAAAAVAPASSSVDPSATRAPRPYRERSASDVFSHRAFDPFRPLYRARHPIRESDSTKYDKVSEHIRNDHLALAENEADTIVSSFYRNKAYQDISETHLNKYTSRLNVRRSPEHLINAGRVTSKIIDPQMKNELYHKIAQKTFPTNHLG
nr:hypothetical protein [Candidatus Anoxychlamydiales bacterium]